MIKTKVYLGKESICIGEGVGLVDNEIACEAQMK